MRPSEPFSMNWISSLYSVKVKVSVTLLCPTVCDPVDCSLLGSSVCGILKAGILEWVTTPFSRDLSRDQTWISCITGRFFTI